MGVESNRRVPIPAMTGQPRILMCAPFFPCADIREAGVQDRVLLPILEIIVLRLGLVNCKAFGLHCVAEQVTQPARFFGPALIVDVGPFAHLVIRARHEHFLTYLHVKQG